MKSVVVSALMAIVLATAGAVLWMEGKAATRLADAHQQLAVLQYAAATAASDEVGERPTLAARLRQLGGERGNDVRQLRTQARYWRAEYPDLMPQRDAAGAITEFDPTILLTNANASFRASQADPDRNSVLRKLDAVVKNYAEVIKANANDPDAAFNYEYTIRVRDNLQRARQASRQPIAQRAGIIGASGDLPAGPTLHGHPGGPPPKTDMSQFKIVIPKRGEERKDDPQAGKGGVKVRKG